MKYYAKQIALITLVLMGVINVACILRQGEFKQVLQVKRVNSKVIVLSCADGADPTGLEIAYHVLSISCGN